MQSLESRVAFITGGASGIGLGMARAFAHAGLDLMLADLDPEALEGAVVDLEGSGARVRGVVCDVADRDSLLAAANEARREFGKIHVLCNNAGIGATGTLEELSSEEWHRITAVNLMGVVLGIQVFLPRIRSHGEGGHVVNTSSVAGLLPSPPGWAAYSATKSAVVALTEVLRQELEGSGIGVSLLCPGAVRTRFAESVRGRADGSEAAPPDADLEAKLDAGLDPLVVGELVLAAIRDGEFFIFTDPELRPRLERRHARLLRGLDWAGRSPLLR
jgi:NAD(P)-dependent dehydrogenase (short-subunit alcohol dehydrogenase family)